MLLLSRRDIYPLAYQPSLQRYDTLLCRQLAACGGGELPGRERGQFIQHPGTPALPCHYYGLCSRYSTIRLGVRWWCGVVVYTHAG